MLSLFLLLFSTQVLCRVCGSHPLVGLSAPLVSLSHNVQGTLTILDDCTFAIDTFTYDGLAPDVFVYFSTELSTIQTGLYNERMRLQRAYEAECLLGQLPGEVTFSVDLAGESIVASIWCRRFSANFAHATINTSSPAIGSPAPACYSSTACPDRLAGTCLAHCVRFTDTFFVWYQLDDAQSTISLELETVTTDEGGYLAFGPADPDGTSVRMTGSDVAIVGVRDGTGFAIDYHLNRYSMCDYSATASQGACPDPTPCTDDVTLVSSVRDGSTTRVRYTRPLAATDECDNAFAPPGSFTSVVFATGQVTGDDGHAPNASNIIVNKHVGTPSVGFRLDVGSEPGPWDCRAAPELPVDPDAPLTTAQCPLSLLELDPDAEHRVTVGPYQVHPQPPGWGIVFLVDGMETPELVVRRGATYTFTVAATKEHPFYVTDSVVGGAVDDFETVYAGGPAAFGTEATPTTVTWTVDAETPDLVFYQCVTHQRLGWRIYVRDEGEEFTLPSDSQTVGTRAAVCDDQTPADEGEGEGEGDNAQDFGLDRTCAPGPFAGRSASLTTRAHDVAGTVTIVDDCTYVVDEFTYDGTGPDVFVYVAPSLAGLEEEDVVVDLDARIARAFDSECLIDQLPGEATFSGVSSSEVVLSVWCRAFAANFGEATVKASSEEGAPSPCFERGAAASDLGAATSLTLSTLVAVCAVAYTAMGDIA
mmetsp:Transcript_8361/g.26693  ORF Transcript_8361/g.26693 Transcript_8361/m.26693 type:complete len:703 (-) Transcript_8361:14-2122(-)